MRLRNRSIVVVAADVDAGDAAADAADVIVVVGGVVIVIVVVILVNINDIMIVEEKHRQ